MVDINTEWTDTYGATVLRQTYRPLTWEQERDGVTATIVIASYREWVPGADIPDGHVFDDMSTVLATGDIPRITKDVSELNKDDKKKRKDLKGSTTSFWHDEIRADIDSAPPQKEYDSNKVYVNPKWDLADQLKAIKDDVVPNRFKKPKKGYRPKWVDEVFGRK